MANERIEHHGDFKYIRMPSGKLFSFYDAINAADIAETAFSRAISRAFKLMPDWPDNPDYKDMDFERIEWALDSMEAYLGAVREYFDEQRGIKSQEDRIALLRNTTGRTPEEAEAFHRKADELEQRLKGPA